MNVDRLVWLLWVAVAATLVLMAASRTARGQDEARKGAAKSYSVPGLELDPPAARTRPGLARVNAKVSAKADSKVKIVWDVEASFEDDDVELDWEVRENGKSIQVVIPDSSGIVRVTAIAVIDGEPTAFAKTAISIDYTPRQKKPLPPVVRPQAQAPPAAAGKVVSAVFVVDPEKTDANLEAVITSQGLANDLRRIGVKRLVLAADSPAIARMKLDGFLKDVGGVPALLLVTDQGKVRKAVRLAARTTRGQIAELAGGK